MRDLYTTREVADIFRVSTKTIKRWRTAGVLEGFRLPNGHLRFTEESVRKLMSTKEK